MKINDVSSQINILKTDSLKDAKKLDASDANGFAAILEKAGQEGDDEKLKEACDQFEAIFINMFMQNIRNAQGEGGIIPKGQGEKMFEGMLDEEMSKEMAKSGGFGISKVMYDQLSKQYGISDPKSVEQETEETEEPKKEYKSFDLKG